MPYDEYGQPDPNGKYDLSAPHPSIPGARTGTNNYGTPVASTILLGIIGVIALYCGFLMFF
ncbi:MAG: hypothetical protein ACYCY2_00420 [Acidithiobacillus ferriphilus]